MKKFIELPKLKAGDQVAVVSPSNGMPQLFPEVFELGLRRLQEEFELITREYSTTRVMGAPLKERAKDLMLAFSDSNNKAVFTSIGGEDQIKLIKYLDRDVFAANPKPFIGYSDNTHIHNYLWNLGIPSYYGGAIMTQFGMQGHMDELTINSIKTALFLGGEYQVEAAREFNDIGYDWADINLLTKRRKYEKNEGLFWSCAQEKAEGRLWGGCVESLIFQATVDRYLPTEEDLRGTILFLETAEDIPEPWLVECLLAGFGERGWFELFAGVLVGRPKAWEFDKPNKPSERQKYRQEQRYVIENTIREYNVDIPIIQNLDFGHTDPQMLLPMGGLVKIDCASRNITFCY